MIGLQFKRKREERSWTQAQLAERLFVSTSMVGQIEAGLKAPSVALVKLAADVFGCSTDDLIRGEEGRA